LVPTNSNRIAHGLQRALQQRLGLGEIDDVDIVAHAEDVIAHLRVPAVRLMAEMDASLEQLAHRIVGQRHKNLLRLLQPKAARPLAGWRWKPDRCRGPLRLRYVRRESSVSLFRKRSCDRPSKTTGRR
jgi:hypothetical protein